MVAPKIDSHVSTIGVIKQRETRQRHGEKKSIDKLDETVCNERYNTVISTTVSGTVAPSFPTVTVTAPQPRHALHALLPQRRPKPSTSGTFTPIHLPFMTTSTMALPTVR